MDPRRAALLVGVGVADRAAGRDPIDLMVAAASAAATDAGAPRLLRAVQQVSVPKGTWPYADPGRLVATGIGASRARTVLAGVGVPQQTLVSDALARILSRELDVVLVVGGEAKRAERDGATARDTSPATPDVRLSPKGEIITGAEIEAGLGQPVRQFALVENALRHAEHGTLAHHRDDIAALWAGFNAVGSDNPRAAFPTPLLFW